ncbi:MAG: hypothetical protein CL862_06555 [Cyanobium sp. NAT70]|nr:hypothetical protein [Cyanobium sp. NAT70]|tara:strand:+ start:526 stop:849 length:324 start_codon:yes stop_codon:yes gene_type:complete
MVIASDRDRPPFLGFEVGDLVLVQPGQNLRQGSMPDWWMGQIICLDLGARDPSALLLLQVSDVDTGAVHWVNADFCTRVVLPGLQGSGHQPRYRKKLLSVQACKQAS